MMKNFVKTIFFSLACLCVGGSGRAVPRSDTSPNLSRTMLIEERIEERIFLEYLNMMAKRVSLQELNKSLEEKADLLDKLGIRIDAFKKELSEKQNASDENKKTSANKNAQLKTLSQEIKQDTDNLQGEKVNNTTLKKNISDNTTVINNFNQKKNELLRKISEMATKLQEEIQTKITLSQKELDAFETLKSTKGSGSLQSSLKVLRDRRNTIPKEEALLDLPEQLKTLQDNKTKELSSENARYEQNKIAIDKKQIRISEKQKELLTEETRFKKAESDIESKFEKSVQDVKLQLKQTILTSFTKTDEIQKNILRLPELDLLTKAESNLADLNTKLTKSNDTIKALTDKITSDKEKSSGLQREIDKLKADIKSLINDIAGLQSKIKENDKTASSLTKEINDIERQIKNAESAIDKYNESVANWVIQILGNLLQYVQSGTDVVNITNDDSTKFVANSTLHSKSLDNHNQVTKRKALLDKSLIKLTKLKNNEGTTQYDTAADRHQDYSQIMKVLEIFVDAVDHNDSVSSLIARIAKVINDNPNQPNYCREHLWKWYTQNFTKYGISGPKEIRSILGIKDASSPKSSDGSDTASTASGSSDSGIRGNGNVGKGDIKALIVPNGRGGARTPVTEGIDLRGNTIRKDEIQGPDLSKATQVDPRTLGLNTETTLFVGGLRPDTPDPLRRVKPFRP